MTVATAPTHRDPAREKLEHDTAIALCAADNALNDEKAFNLGYKAVREAITGYSDDTLHTITKNASTEIGYTLLKIIWHDSMQEEHLNDWMMFVHFAMGNDIYNYRHVVRSLSNYDLAPQSQPLRRYDQGVAIIRVTSYLLAQETSIITSKTNDETKSVMVSISERPIRDLLVTSENPGAVADLIIQRNITKADQLKLILESNADGAKVLASGVL